MALLRTWHWTRDSEARKRAIWRRAFQVEAQAGTRTLRWERAWFVQTTARRPVQPSGRSQERAGEDRVEEARRQTAEPPGRLGFLWDGQRVGGLSAEGCWDVACVPQDASAGCVENRLQKRQEEKQETCQEGAAATREEMTTAWTRMGEGSREKWLDSGYILKVK